MTVAAVRHLKAAIGTHGYHREIHEGVPLSETVALDIVRVSGPLRNAMTRMVRDHEFDLCEVSPTSYLMARARGARLSALPVFPYRQFPFDQLVVRDSSPVTEPSTVGGASVGLRTWAQPTGLWIREILASRYGADLTTVQWTFVAEDPVAGLARPAGSVSRSEETLTSLLIRDLVDLVMGATDVPDGCHQLLTEPLGEARDWYASEGIIPANHVVVVRNDVLESGLAPDICRLFERAKQRYLEAGAADANVQHLRDVTGLEDPLPNGWTANAKMWSRLIESMVRQGMLAAESAAGELLLPIEL